MGGGGFTKGADGKGKEKGKDKGKGKGDSSGSKGKGDKGKASGVEKGDKGKGNKGKGDKDKGGKGNPQMFADLAWLKSQKELPGADGFAFQSVWKSWCAKENVQTMEKHQWAAAIARFRVAFEAGDLRKDLNDVSEAKARDNAVDATDDLDWLKTMKDQPGEAGEAFLKIWRAWCGENKVCGMKKHEWAAALARFRQSHSGGDDASGNCAKAPAVHVPFSAPAKTQSSASKSAAKKLFEPSDWLLRASSGVKKLLDAARISGALKVSSAPSTCSPAEWQQLVSTGKQALSEATSAFSSSTAGSFLGEKDCASLSMAACSAACLRTTFEILGVRTLLQQAGSKVDEVEWLTAAIGELQGAAADLKSAGARARRGLLDILCLVGTALE